VPPTSDDDEPPDWSPPSITEADALKYVGKYIILGITKEDAFGKITDQYQVHGVIELVASNGICISLRGSRQGESCTMPPALDHLHPAPPGDYRLRTHQAAGTNRAASNIPDARHLAHLAGAVLRSEQFADSLER
jgi:hypothetical protein